MAAHPVTHAESDTGAATDSLMARTPNWCEAQWSCVSAPRAHTHSLLHSTCVLCVVRASQAPRASSVPSACAALLCATDSHATPETDATTNTQDTHTRTHTHVPLWTPRSKGRDRHGRCVARPLQFAPAGHRKQRTDKGPGWGQQARQAQGGRKRGRTEEKEGGTRCRYCLGRKRACGPAPVCPSRCVPLRLRASQGIPLMCRCGDLRQRQTPPHSPSSAHTAIRCHHLLLPRWRTRRRCCSIRSSH